MIAKKDILDGFPRTIPQAEALTAALAKDNDAIDYALEIFLEDQAIIDRMSGRRVCKSCGAGFHVENFLQRKKEYVTSVKVNLSQEMMMFLRL